MALYYNTAEATKYFHQSLDPCTHESRKYNSETDSDSENENDNTEDGVTFQNCDGGQQYNSTVDLFDDSGPPETPDGGSIGDILLFNNILLYCDMLLYWEFRTSIKDGDVGCTFEIIKLLHQALDLWFHFSEKMKRAMFSNYVICPSGRSDGRVEHDLLQEHHNFWIKQVFNGWEAVALNIVPLKELAQNILEKFGLANFFSGHVKTNIMFDTSGNP
ncbi:uncharacterized protein EI90DRAFT_3012173 [Cantharellus anzutake]|uniref:uncharacterized protein n=1 Tax=Cantharellus anzutake TaxID=1750568 RepID=UPI0019063390|nr:uncharacterized protein EI90DRAFT_3012173 [Cantharellus anzutake]KAF8341666.1 hypothetical protein EI90DRAFT_3012173 [Cantharellus anzutake]